MSRFTLSRAATVLVATAGLAAAGAFGGVASAQTAEPSTPVPITAPDGTIMSYILNATDKSPGNTKNVVNAVVAEGGTVVQAWPEIGVVIAHSTKSSFRADITAALGSALESVGATRTVPVSEGTPSGAFVLPAKGASSYKKGAKGAYNGDIAAKPTPATSVDPREGEQWDMSMINADKAHAITDGNPNVLVGVLDSGIDPDHPDLAANISIPDSVNCTTAGRPDTSATGWYPTTSDHGTHVAGTIAAARNGVGIVGVAPAVRMAAVKVVNDDGFIYPEYAVCGFMWAGLKHMDVTNNSYYVDPFQFFCDDQIDQHAAKEAVRRAVAYSIDQGVASAAAAGNAAYDLSNKTTDTVSPNDSTGINRTINDSCDDIPAELPGVVTVSSAARVGTTTDFTLSGFSNRGLGKIDVTAPGSSILSTIVRDNGYGLKSGTSMASPHVAGVLALIKSAHPELTPAQMVAKLRADAMDHACTTITSGAACVGTAADNSYFGEGMIDALAAVK